MTYRKAGLITLVSTLSTGLGGAAELKHLWDFEGEEWWVDKVGEADGEEPADTSTLTVEPGVGERGASLKIQAEISGGNDHLLLASNDLYEPGTEAFSMFFWVRMPDDMTTAARGIFDFSGNGGDGVQSLYIGAAGDLAFRIDFPGAGVALVRVPIDLEDGEWHSVAATYDPQGRLEVHIDGFGVDGFADAVAGPVTFASECYLGSFNFTGTSDLKGVGGNIDDFAIYSGVLSEEEITLLSTPPDPPAKPDLVINSISVSDDSVTITWDAEEGTFFGVWRSADLVTWEEVDDNVAAGAEGGSYNLQFQDAKPDRLFLEVRRIE
ncbi:LamG domain-containing protein [Akkermansiaceae bacterium]|nr:LamG domain-containing protein [bacterium]MDA9830968.1 LamG domain-containing protein [Akkermansiaceae bacterium]